MLLKKLAFATALTVAAFAVQAQAQEPRRGGTIRFTAPYGASFVSNDSHVSNQIQDEIYGYALHSMLYKWDAKNSKPALDLAKSVTVSPDGKVAITTSETTNMAHWIDTSTQSLFANTLVDARPRHAERDHGHGRGGLREHAERLLDGTGWLPDPLRLAESTDMSVTPRESTEELPAFLADGEREIATDESAPAAIAAE